MNQAEAELRADAEGKEPYDSGRRRRLLRLQTRNGASEQMIGLTSECVIDMPRNIHSFC